jgi:hypothetical protein
MNISLCAHILEDLWPYRNFDLSDMGRSQQVHMGSGLSDSASDAQRNLIVEDGSVVGKIEKFFLTGHL